MPQMSKRRNLASLLFLLALLAAACGGTDPPQSRIGGSDQDETRNADARTGSDPRDGLQTGIGGGSDPTQTGDGGNDFTSGVAPGSGGADPTGRAQADEGFDGTKSWDMLIAQLGGVATSTYTASYKVAGNPAVKSVDVVNLPPRQAVTVRDAVGNRHWALFENGKPARTCISYGKAWRCKPFDKDDYTTWVSVLLTTGFSPTFLAGLLSPALLAEGPVPAYAVTTETVLGQSATCITTSKVDQWPGAKVCLDRMGVPLTVTNKALGNITMTSLTHSADPAAFSPPA